MTDVRKMLEQAEVAAVDFRAAYERLAETLEFDQRRLEDWQIRYLEEMIDRDGYRSLVFTIPRASGRGSLVQFWQEVNQWREALAARVAETPIYTEDRAVAAGEALRARLEADPIRLHAPMRPYPVRRATDRRLPPSGSRARGRE